MPELAYPKQDLLSGQVRLRAWEQTDVQFVVDACGDPEISRYSPVIPHPYTQADAETWLALQPYERAQGTGIAFAVVHASSGAPLGAIGLHNVNWLLNWAETGYWLARSARGNGYMTSAVCALVAWAFDELGLDRVALTNDPQNEASQAVARRSGFTLEGRLRSHMRIGHSGERRDSLVWGILPDEIVRQR